MSNISPYRTPVYPVRQGDEGNFPFQEEETASLRDYWTVIQKYRWTIVAFLLPSCLLAGLALWWSPSVYTATATLYLENRSPNITGAPEAFTLPPVSLVQYYQTQLNLLKSRSLAARVIHDLGLVHDPRFVMAAEDLSGWAQRHARQGVKFILTWIQETSVVQWLRERLIGVREEPQKAIVTYELGLPPDLIDRYLNQLTLTLLEDSQLVNVSFTSVDPSFAKDVVNAHVSTFIRTSLLTRFELTGEARQFLEEKLAELKVQLGKSEENLNRFRKTHAIVALDKGENFIVERMKGLNTDLAQARSRRIELESLYRIVQERDNQLLSQIIDNPLIQQMKEQIAALEVEKARMGTVFKPTYAAVDSLQQQIKQAKGRMDQEVRRIVRSISSDFTAAKAREDALTDEMERQRRAALDLREKAVEAAVLEREVESSRTLYDNILKRTKETDLTGTVPISSIRVVDRADIPLNPDDGNRKRNLLMSVFLGLFGGVGLAFLRYYLNNTLKTPDDVSRYLRLPTLGLVPDIRRLDNRVYGAGRTRKLPFRRRVFAHKRGEGAALTVTPTPYSVVSESYQTICTALLFSQPERPPRTILITSSVPKEGKTASAINIALVLAWNGKPVLLVDADLRNGRCHKLLGVENGQGLTDVLTGNGTAANLIKKTSTENLFLLPRGHTPPNPAQLLGSEELVRMLASLSTDFSFIIIDSAPLLPISDSVLLATKVDGVVLVARGQEVSRHVARQACDRLTYVRANVLGVILNGLDIHSPEYKDYKSSYVSYYTGYASPDV
jgi:succinoglycan biosynthesis transport protein ExoP